MYPSENFSVNRPSQEISSHIAAKKLIFRHHKLRLNISVKRMMLELLAYNGTFSTTPYSGAGLEMYSIVLQR